MVSPRELQRPMLALEFTKWNLIWISDELPLCELPRKLRAMVGTKTRIWASCNDTLITAFFVLLRASQYSPAHTKGLCLQ